ncbi:MAG: VWA domain-containing protein [Stappiaceae bacterium]
MAKNELTGKTGNPASLDKSSKADIESFLDRAQQIQPSDGANGRLLFALDATMSRQRTWDRACTLQAGMFEEAGKVSGLDIQLIYFRGYSECRSSKWVSDAKRLRDLMTRIDCRGGHTQITKVLAHAIKETRRKKVQALVFVGDCMEEKADDLCMRAGELGLLGVPVFVFQEGHDADAEPTFREIARLTNGAYFRFDNAAAKHLGDLLRAIAVYAAGGRKALQNLRGESAQSAQQLLTQMKP